mgnify:CR=1 FL=1
MGNVTGGPPAVPGRMWDRPIYVVSVFIVVSALWIILSDLFLYQYIENTSLRVAVSVIKGLGYISITSLIIYYIVKKGFDNLRSSRATIKRGENRFRAMFKHAPLATVEVGEDGRIIRPNVAMAELSGLPPERLAGMRLDDLFTTPAGPARTGLFRGEGDRSEEERRLRKADGSEVWVNVTSSLVRDHEGQPCFVMEMLEDIGARKEYTSRLEQRVAERTEQLSKTNEQLQVTLESIGDGVVVTDVDSNILMVNQRARAMFGWEADPVGRPLDAVLDLVDVSGMPVLPAVARPLAGAERAVSGHRLILRQDGVERYIGYTSASILGREGVVSGLVTVFRDETLEVRMYEETAKVQRLESVGSLAGGLAHNLNNILTIIDGNLALALEDCQASRPIDRRIADARSASRRARDLASHLLTFARGGEPIRAAVALPPLLEEALGIRLAGAQTRVVKALPGDLWDIDGDRGQIVQALGNIISFSSRSMGGRGEMVITATNVPGVGAGGQDFVRLVMEDRGLGLTKAQLEKVSELDFADWPEGLELSIARQIITRHGGSLAIDSTPSGPTIYSVLLPRAKGAEEARPQTVKTGARILWMDDEDLLRDLNEEFLEELGHHGTMVRNGREAIVRYEEGMSAGRPFDLVILDLIVPGEMGGLEAFEIIKRLDPGVRAIVCSGYSTDPVMSSYREHGFVGVLPKPYTMEDLADAIDGALAGGPPGA